MKTPKHKRSLLHDAFFLIKAALYLLLGTVWIAFGGHRWVPIGVIVGFAFSQIEILRLDRKIEYALLVVGALLGLYGLGITIQL
jgi:hypothetical protein